MVVANDLALLQHQGVVVQDVHQLRLHIAYGDVALAAGVNLARLGVIVVAGALHEGLTGGQRVVVEVEHVGARHAVGALVAERRGVDIVEVESLVLRDEEGIVGAHGHEVVLEVHAQVVAVAVSILDGPVHHAHVGIFRGGGKHGAVLVGHNHVVDDVDDTIVGDGDVELSVLLAVEDVERQAHVLGGVVGDVGELRGNGLREAGLEQVLGERREDLGFLGEERVDVLHEVGLVVDDGSLAGAAVDVDEVRAATTRQEVLFHGVIVWHEEGSDVLDSDIDIASLRHAGVVLVPAWVEVQDEVARALVAIGVAGELVGPLRAGAEIAHLVDAVDGGTAVGLCPVVILARGGIVVIRSSKVVQDAAVVLRPCMTAQHLCHVARRHEHVFHLMHIAVLAGHVAINHLVVEDVGGALGVGAAGENGEVALVAQRGDVVVEHVLTRQVHHHGARVVAHHVDALVVVLLPVTVALGHVGQRGHVLDAVDDAHVGGMLHGSALHGVVGAVAGVGQQAKK